MEQCVEADYEAFAANLNELRRKEQEKQAPQEALKNARTVEEAKRLAAERETRQRAQQAQLAAAPLNLNVDNPKLIVDQIVSKIASSVAPIISSTGSSSSHSSANGTQATSLSIKIDPSSVLTGRDIQNAILKQQLQQEQSSSNKTATKAARSSAADSNSAAATAVEEDNSELNRFLLADDPFKQQAMSKGYSNAQMSAKLAASNQLQEDKPNNAEKEEEEEEEEADDDDDDGPCNPMVAAFKDTISDEDGQDAVFSGRSQSQRSDAFFVPKSVSTASKLSTTTKKEINLSMSER